MNVRLSIVDVAGVRYVDLRALPLALVRSPALAARIVDAVRSAPEPASVVTFVLDASVGTWLGGTSSSESFLFFERLRATTPTLRPFVAGDGLDATHAVARAAGLEPMLALPTVLTPEGATEVRALLDRALRG